MRIVDGATARKSRQHFETKNPSIPLWSGATGSLVLDVNARLTSSVSVGSNPIVDATPKLTPTRASLWKAREAHLELARHVNDNNTWGYDELVQLARFTTRRNSRSKVNLQRSLARQPVEHQEQAPEAIRISSGT
jgi:hypothetical protein